MMKRILLIGIVLIFLMFCAFNTAFAEMKHEGATVMRMHEVHEHHKGGRVPIGVMGGHTHHAGKWMLTYRYMYMDMEGNRDATNKLGTSDVLKDFAVSPTQMTIQMHMIGLMYAPSDKLTFMSMIPYVHKEMDHITRMKTEFTTRTEGIGDITLTGLYNVYQSGPHQVHFNG
jgi:hypothetical protein